MAFAMQWPNGKHGGDRGNQHTGGKLTESTCQDKDFDKSLLSRARYVLRNSPMVEGERYPRRCLSTNVHRRHLTKGQQAESDGYGNGVS